jgi:hypothetical protein
MADFGGGSMTKLDCKSIDDMPAGRGMDGLIHSLALGKSFENYCLHSLHPDDGQCNGCDLPCPMPRYSIRWDLIPKIISKLNEHDCVLYLVQTSSDALPGNWLAQITRRGIPPSVSLWKNIPWHAYGQDAPDAVGRAALKWAVDREKEQ